MDNKSCSTVDDYIQLFSGNCKLKLQEIREIILTLLPEAAETISYQIPAYKINTTVIYFAGFKNHISLYPAPRNIEGFEELSNYKGGKGTVQFALDKDLPLDLIKKIILYRKRINTKK
jgi:uncharacterized protein YdhG (YjbR/CyaY superfamily)